MASSGIAPAVPCLLCWGPRKDTEGHKGTQRDPVALEELQKGRAGSPGEEQELLQWLSSFAAHGVFALCDALPL